MFSQNSRYFFVSWKETIVTTFNNLKQKIESFNILYVYVRRACGHVDVGTSPHQVLAATLTLSQPGGQIMPTLCTSVHTKF